MTPEEIPARTRAELTLDEGRVGLTIWSILHFESGSRKPSFHTFQGLDHDNIAWFAPYHSDPR